MTCEQILALLRDPSDDILERLFDAGTRPLTETEGFSTDGVKTLLGELADIIETAPRA